MLKPARADTPSLMYDCVRLTQSYFKLGAAALTGFGYQIFYTIVLQGPVAETS